MHVLQECNHFARFFQMFWEKMLMFCKRTTIYRGNAVFLQENAMFLGGTEMFCEGTQSCLWGCNTFVRRLIFANRHKSTEIQIFQIISFFLSLYPLSGSVSFEMFLLIYFTQCTNKSLTSKLHSITLKLLMTPYVGYCILYSILKNSLKYTAQYAIWSKK